MPIRLRAIEIKFRRNMKQSELTMPNDKKKKAVSIVGIVGLPANYGGFETLVEQMVLYLGNEINFRVFCSSKSYNYKDKTYPNATLNYIPISANGLSSVFYDIWGLLMCLGRQQTILILGVSAGLFLPIFRLISRNKLVVNIDGIEWRRAKWGRLAKIFLRYSERAAVWAAHEIITDNAVIQNYVKDQYGYAAHLIEYGGDHALKTPEMLSEKSLSLLPEHVLSHGAFALAICRIEPENNVEMILEAFCKLNLMPIIFIGNWKSSGYGQALLEKFKRSNVVHMIDPIYDQNILNWLRSNCRVYLHGHSAGGTNPSLVEAMWAGAPVFCYDVNFNRVTTENKGYYFSSASDLKDKLSVFTMEDANSLGRTMQGIAKKRYRWQDICSRYKKLF